MKTTIYSRSAMVLLISTLLSACGGSDGGSESSNGSVISSSSSNSNSESSLSSSKSSSESSSSSSSVSSSSVFSSSLSSSSSQSSSSKPAVTGKPYKGAEIYSFESHRYGKYVMRMRVAKASGVLSTFFLYKNGSQEPGTFWEEIDIEIFGQKNAIYWESNIIWGNPKKQSYVRHTATESLADSYHTFILEWTPAYVAWFVNGQEIRRINGESSVTSLTTEQTMRFNLWSAHATSWVGPFDPDDLPVHQFINYMEYHSYNANTEKFTLQWRDDFNVFDAGRWGKAAWTFDDNRVDFVPENVTVKDGVLVLSLTRGNETGFDGDVPADD